MTRERWYEVQFNDDAKLSESEVAAGWHFCDEFDCLLVGPGMGELRCCTCECSKHVPRPPEEPVDPNFAF